MRKIQCFLAFRIWSFLLVPIGIISCGPVNYAYVGNWVPQADPRAYINDTQKMRLSFPNEKWQIYPRPPIDLEEKWQIPSDSPIPYHLLMANFPPDLKMELLVQPATAKVSLEEFLALRRFRLLIKRFENNKKDAHINIILDKHGQHVGIITTKIVEDEVNKLELQAIYKEQSRFTILSFSSPEASYELSRNQFWEIIDSYHSP